MRQTGLATVGFERYRSMGSTGRVSWHPVSMLLEMDFANRASLDRSLASDMKERHMH